MRGPSVPQPLHRALAQSMDPLVKRLSRILVSSIRAVRDYYLPQGTRGWRPRAGVSGEGCLILEGFEFCFLQVRADVEGGSGLDPAGKPFRTRGGNRLERVYVTTLETPGGTRFAVFLAEFADEEHPLPLLDTVYRLVRALVVGRTRDLEAIVVVFPRGSQEKGVAVVFPYICSRGKTYASRLGAHATCVEMVRGRRATIFVSNVWNHAMSTINTNPGMSLVNPRPLFWVNGAPLEGQKKRTG